MPEVRYTDLAISDDGQVILTGQGNSYTAVAKQLYLFQKSEFVSAVDINSMNQTTGNQESREIDFNVQLKLKDSSLLK